jgi:hypothetical protein
MCIVGVWVCGSVWCVVGSVWVFVCFWCARVYVYACVCVCVCPSFSSFAAALRLWRIRNRTRPAVLHKGVLRCRRRCGLQGELCPCTHTHTRAHTHAHTRTTHSLVVAGPFLLTGDVYSSLMLACIWLLLHVLVLCMYLVATVDVYSSLVLPCV